MQKKVANGFELSLLFKGQDNFCTIREHKKRTILQSLTQENSNIWVSFCRAGILAVLCHYKDGADEME